MERYRMSVLLVCSRKPPAQLLSDLEENASVSKASSYFEASEALSGSPRFQAVVTDEWLIDGDWRDVLAAALETNAGMEVMVFTGPKASMKLFMEARSLGARGLLVEPHDAYQIRCLFENARFQRDRKSIPATRAQTSSEAAAPAPVTSVLSISDGDAHADLVRCLQSYGLVVHCASDRQGLRCLLEGNSFDFVITAERLVDANWKDVVEEVKEACPLGMLFVVGASELGLMLETIRKGAVFVNLPRTGDGFLRRSSQT
jgi:DNA-binding NtrC family response regulator